MEWIVITYIMVFLLNMDGQSSIIKLIIGSYLSIGVLSIIGTQLLNIEMLKLNKLKLKKKGIIKYFEEDIKIMLLIIFFWPFIIMIAFKGAKDNGLLRFPFCLRTKGKIKLKK